MNILYGPNFNIIDETVVTIGKFDGVHLGHRKVLEEVKKTASKYNLKSVVYTFLVNPKLVLHQENFIPLMTNEEKSRAIEEAGIDYLVYEDFNESFSKMEPEEFVKEILVAKANAKVVIMGKNCTFGNNRTGNVQVMKALGTTFGFRVFCVDMVMDDGEFMSSTKIREKDSKNLSVELQK